MRRLRRSSVPRLDQRGAVLVRRADLAVRDLFAQPDAILQRRVGQRARRGHMQVHDDTARGLRLHAWRRENKGYGPHAAVRPALTPDRTNGGGARAGGSAKLGARQARTGRASTSAEKVA